MHIRLLSMAVALAFAGSAWAQSGNPASPNPEKARVGERADRGVDQRPKVDRKAKDAEEERIEATAKADKARCEPMKGNEKNVCQAEAKAKEKIAKAELDAKYDSSPRKQRKAEEMKAEGEYEVAKTKCDAQKGKPEDACEKEAKAKYNRAKADIKVKYATSERKAATGSTAK